PGGGRIRSGKPGQLLREPLEAEIESERRCVLLKQAPHLGERGPGHHTFDARGHGRGFDGIRPDTSRPSIAARSRSAPSTILGPGRDVYAFPSSTQTGTEARRREALGSVSRSSSSRARATPNPHSMITIRSGLRAAAAFHVVREEWTPGRAPTSKPPAASTRSGTQCPAR